MLLLPKEIKSVYYSSKTISYLGPKLWNLVPESIKLIISNQKLNFGSLKVSYVGHVKFTCQ